MLAGGYDLYRGTSAAMTNLTARVLDRELTPFERLVVLMEILRSPDGCNWDRKQTHESLIPYLVEETYEVIEAIETGRYADLCEELGDLLTQIVFHGQLAKERGEFDVNDSLSQVVTKLINRHPHVFGEQKDLDPQQVRDQWERIKTESGEKKSVLSGLPRTMPALTSAFRLGEKAGGVGFDWKRAEDVLEKISEEVSEVKAEMAKTEALNREKVTNEIGDLLFAVASLARKLDIDPEYALRQALSKFRDRFERLERKVRNSGGEFDAYTLEELEAIWQSIKGNDAD
jgi:tetrapyrrole methylase family protein/MazG family protein